MVEALTDIKSPVLWSGMVSWTVNEDAMKVVDIPDLPIAGSESLLLCVCNRSAVVDLVVNSGIAKACYSSDATSREVMDCTLTTTANTVTVATGHNLVVGDCVSFGTTTGGVTAGNLYYVIAVTSTTVFQVATARAGSAAVISATGYNTVYVAKEFFALTTTNIPKFAAGTTTAPVAGLVCAVLTGLGWSGLRLMLEKSTATAAAFNAYIELRRIQA